MDEVWATGSRHVKISKLYLKGLLKRGPNIFVALAWSQVSTAVCLRIFVPSTAEEFLFVFIIDFTLHVAIILRYVI